MNSPFQYGKPATGTTFISRQEEKHQLQNNISSGTNSVIISPRRWGKSSLIREALSDLVKEQQDISVCYVDVFHVRSESEFYLLYAKEVIKSVCNCPEEWSATVMQFLQEIAPLISVETDPKIDFTITHALNTLKGHESYILDLPERIAKEKGIRIVICADEFQNLARLREFSDLQTTLNRTWKGHSRVNYCICGSKRHIMAEIFNTQQNPFYHFGEIILLQKIDENEWIQYIVDQFKRTGKSISRIVATDLVQKVKCHTWYVPQYAHFAWILTSNNTTEQILSEAFSQILNAFIPLYKRECEAMTASQLSLLVAIANKEKAFTSTTVMHNYGLGTPQNVSKNKEILQRRDLVEKTPEGFVFLDPVFEFWFTVEFVHK